MTPTNRGRPVATSTAVATAPRNPAEQKLVVINQRFKRLEPHLRAVLPRYATPERMVRVALLAINRQPELLACTPESLAESVMTIATWGLEIGRTAHLVAYYDGVQKVYKSQAQADWKGMVELAIRGKSITSCRARVVYERDRFEVEYGLTERLVHIPTWRADPGSMVGVYAVVRFPSGDQLLDLMSREDVLRIKQRSKLGAKDKGPWKTDEAEMWKKTVVRRLLKSVPQNPLLAAALALDVDEDTVRDVGRAANTGLTGSGVRTGGYDAGVADLPNDFRKAPGEPAGDTWDSKGYPMLLDEETGEYRERTEEEREAFDREMDAEIAGEEVGEG